MSRRRRRIAGLVVGAAAVGAAGAAVEVVRHRRRPTAVEDQLDVPLGSLRSTPRTVLTHDGVPLYVEVDEVEPSAGKQRGRRRTPEPVTAVFVHGYALNLDCWHFQRLALRGRVRTVFYDQRSHGRSGRSPRDHSTIDQLGADLLEVVDQVVPDGRVVLVGHSMGGMAILALAETHPELFGTRVAGVGLVSTTAGGLSPHQIILPMLPEGVGGELARRLVAGLARTAKVVDGIRMAGKDIAVVATNLFSFGGPVPPSYPIFVDQLLSGTPFEVLAEFFPSFESLDKFAVISAFERVPTTIIGGTADRMTAIGHSRKMHSLLPHSTLLELEGAGHMAIMECADEVNEALSQLLAEATAHVPVTADEAGPGGA